MSVTNEPVYISTRAAIFDAATRCRARGKPIVVRAPGLTRPDAERAFDEWLDEHDDDAGVTMELETGENGALSARFTPVSADAA